MGLIRGGGGRRESLHKLVLGRFNIVFPAIKLVSLASFKWVTLWILTFGPKDESSRVIDRRHENKKMNDI